MTSAAESLEIQSRVLALFAPHEHFSRSVLDAFVVIDETGKIVKYNGHFLKMARIKPRTISRSETMDDIIRIQIEDRLHSVRDILRYRVPSHFEHAIGKLPEVDEDLHLVLGVYPFVENGRQIGAFVLIRDITAETNLQGKYEHKAVQSVTDKLTRLYNRGYFDQYLPDCIAKIESLPVEASGRALSLMILDIDHFKKCNDTYGHQAGDYVISEVATLLRHTLRKDDVTCRYGGEEFVAVLSGVSVAETVAIAETLRQRVATHVFTFEGTNIPITVSLGVAEVGIGQESGTDALARADGALYQSKRNGRNQTTVGKR